MTAGALIAVVGNAGVGKTTLVERLAAAGSFAVGVERHTERPFHGRLAADARRYALANQIDFLLWRAEQEQALRRGPLPGLVDGGLELDYHGFVPLFAHKGYLDADEQRLCDRLYAALRRAQPPPDLLIHLTAPPEVIIARHRARGRVWEAAQTADLATLGRLIDGWLAATTIPILTVDASNDNWLRPTAVQELIARIDRSLRAQGAGQTGQPDGAG